MVLKKKNVTTNNIFIEYINFFNKFQERYGENSIVLIMVGMFYEMYSLNDNKMGPNLSKISSMLNVLCTRKNKNNISASSSLV